MLLLLVAILVSSRKISLSRKILQNQNKPSINLSLLYHGVSGQKFNPLSKIDFSDRESFLCDMLNMFESSKCLVVRDGSLLMVDRLECCYHLNF